MAGKVILAKRLRMTLDFEVEVEELTDEGLRRHYQSSKNFAELVGDSALWKNLSRQICLQRALVEDGEALGKYLTYAAVCEVDPSTGGRLGEVFGVGRGVEEEELLGPVFHRLGEDDANYFREVSADGVLFESVEALSQSFKVRWVSSVLEAIQVIASAGMGEETNELSR